METRHKLLSSQIVEFRRATISKLIHKSKMSCRESFCTGSSINTWQTDAWLWISVMGIQPSHGYQSRISAYGKGKLYLLKSFPFLLNDSVLCILGLYTLHFGQSFDTCSCLPSNVHWCLMTVWNSIEWNYSLDMER